ncbi:MULTISPECIES: LmeA family phospholipid-binding protein [Hoyosella]|uniref:Uncharacterized protein n=2 Tax=Hoyosella TaxID=697025 RepID=F6EH13_HOYSD|nr:MULTISPECIES: LmeA family phospholipid-binding protein [Hoyosella]AEF38837.1 hypothetical protein AS9A_0378 [Hoyosella subflava DQS3-9A1]MBB3037723.1 hypothetical protein [Hoyosella altamirensis]
MNSQRLFGDWLPWREVDRLLALGKSLRPTVPTSPAGLVQLILRVASDRLLGRRITIQTGDTDVSFTPVEIDSDFHTLGLATGQIAAIRFVANHVRWERTTLQRVEVTFTDTRLRSLPAPYLVVGLVTVRITVTSTEVHHWVKQVAPDIHVDITKEGKVQASWARAPMLGHIELRPTAGDSVIYLDPTGLQIWQRSLPVAHRMKPFAIAVPDLPHGLQLTSIETGPEELILHGVTDRVRERISSMPLADVLTMLLRLIDQFT